MTIPKSIQAALREIIVAVAGVWVLAGAKPMTEYVFRDHKWVEISIRYNGEHEKPRRRVEDKEGDYLAPKESRLDALMSDRSIDA